jgi:outer membrane lipoprotein-sorting protein
MRWDYIGAKGKRDRSFIFDGTTLWFVDTKNLQVLQHKTPTSTLPAAVAFLNGSGKLAADFDVAAGDDANTVKLTPKQTSAQVKELHFVIDPSTYHVLRSIVIDHNGDTSSFTFSSVDPKTKPKASYFVFDPKSVPTFKVVQVP